MSEPRVVVPWTLLGLAPGAGPPERFVVVVARASEHATFLGGIVVEAGTFEMPDEDEPFDEARLAVVNGGLFDEGIFGAVPRRADGTLALDRPEERQHFFDRPQAKTFGTIVLPEPIRSPWEKKLGVSVGTIRQIPVLPAGLRPVYLEGGRSYRSHLTMLYEELVLRCGRFERILELGLEEVIDLERRRVADAVAALFVDGAKTFVDEEGETDWVIDADDLALHEDLGEEPTGEYMSLTEVAGQHDPSRFFRWLDLELRTNRRAMSASRWPGDAHLWRACLWAAGLDIMPLHEDGSIDEETASRARLARRVQTAHIVQDRVLGDGGIDVLHVEGDGGHLDIHAYRHEGAILLLTQGMAAHDCDRELLCLLPTTIDAETRRQISTAPLSAARVPSRYEALHTYEHAAPFANGLAGFIMLDPLDFERLSQVDTLEWLLPLHPQFLLAVGVDAASLQQPSRAALAASLVASGGITSR